MVAFLVYDKAVFLWAQLDWTDWARMMLSNVHGSLSNTDQSIELNGQISLS